MNAGRKTWALVGAIVVAFSFLTLQGSRTLVPSASANENNYDGSCGPFNDLPLGNAALIDANAYVFLDFWGWENVNDTQKFESNLLWALQANSPGGAFGGTRWFNVPSLYGGTDWQSGSYVSAPANYANLVTSSTWIVDSTFPPPTGTPTRTQIEAEVAVIQSLHEIQKDVLIGIILPPGLTKPTGYDTLGVGFCGWHGSKNGVLYFYLSYPDQTSGCGTTADGGAQGQVGTAAHEIQESINDSNGNGWLGGQGECEVVDLCGSEYSVQIQSVAESGPAGGSPIQTATTVYSSEKYAAMGGTGNDNLGCVYSRSTEAFAFGVGNWSGASLYAQSLGPTSALNESAFYSWGNPGVSFQRSPGATSWGPGDLEVFIEGSNGTMYKAHSLNYGVTNDWETLGGSLPSGFTAFSQSPDAVSWGTGNAQVWVVGSIETVPTIMRNGFDWGANPAWYGWTTWNSNVSGLLTYKPASKVTVASAGASNLTGPLPAQTLNIAYFDSLGGLNLGYLIAGGNSINWTARIIPTYDGQTISWDSDPDMGIAAPGNLGVFFTDTYGQEWVCVSNDQETFGGGCYPAGIISGGFVYGAGNGPGVSGLGDGRWLITGIQNGGHTAYTSLWDWAEEGFSADTGQIAGSLDVAAW